MSPRRDVRKGMINSNNLFQQFRDRHILCPILYMMMVGLHQFISVHPLIRIVYLVL